MEENISDEINQEIAPLNLDESIIPFAIGPGHSVALPDTPSILRTIEVRFIQELVESK